MDRVTKSLLNQLAQLKQQMKERSDYLKARSQDPAFHVAKELLGKGWRFVPWQDGDWKNLVLCWWGVSETKLRPLQDWAMYYHDTRERQCLQLGIPTSEENFKILDYLRDLSFQVYPPTEGVVNSKEDLASFDPANRTTLPTRVEETSKIVGEFENKISQHRHETLGAYISAWVKWWPDHTLQTLHLTNTTEIAEQLQRNFTEEVLSQKEKLGWNEVIFTHITDKEEYYHFWGAYPNYPGR